MTEHFKAPEKIQISEEEIANLLDAQFKKPVIKTLAEFVQKVDEKTKAMPRETKENVQGTNSDAKETGTNQWCGPEGRKKHPTRKE